MNREVSIGLINPKTPSNVGAIMRAAGCYQVGSIFYTGSRFDMATRYNTDTKEISRDILLSNVDSLLDVVPENTNVVCVELVEGATPLPDFQHPEKAFYIFGPEDGTIDQQTIDKADAVVYIPTIGCMNLGATVNVVLYDRLAKLGMHIAGDELIRQSRDMKNRVKVRKQDVNI